MGTVVYKSEYAYFLDDVKGLVEHLVKHIHGAMICPKLRAEVDLILATFYKSGRVPDWFKLSVILGKDNAEIFAVNDKTANVLYEAGCRSQVISF